MIVGNGEGTINVTFVNVHPKGLEPQNEWKQTIKVSESEINISNISNSNHDDRNSLSREEEKLPGKEQTHN